MTNRYPPDTKHLNAAGELARYFRAFEGVAKSMEWNLDDEDLLNISMNCVLSDMDLNNQVFMAGTALGIEQTLSDQRAENSPVNKILKMIGTKEEK